MKTTVLGVMFDKVTPKQALERAMSFLDTNTAHTIFTPNPEIVMAARRDKEFMEILNNADMVIPDGIGIVYASKLNKIKLKERVTGYDLLQDIFEEIRKTDKTVCFLGGAPGVAEKAKENMEKQYKGLKINCVHDGYFDEKKEKEIINDIMQKKSDIILVGIGFPRQEKWIAKNKDMLSASIYMGVGGSFDGMAGIVPRAPKIFRKLGLEWFYRLLKQPSRFKRQLQLPLFMLITVWERIHGIFKK